MEGRKEEKSVNKETLEGTGDGRDRGDTIHLFCFYLLEQNLSQPQKERGTEGGGAGREGNNRGAGFRVCVPLRSLKSFPSASLSSQPDSGDIYPPARRHLIRILALSISPFLQPRPSHQPHVFSPSPSDFTSPQQILVLPTL